MTTRGIRRKKSTLSEVKVAVVGLSSVGKSGKDFFLFFFLLNNKIVFLIFGFKNGTKIKKNKNEISRHEGCLTSLSTNKHLIQ